MKYILSIVLFIGLSIVSKSQVDSSQLYIPFQIKQKFAAVMVPKVPGPADQFLMDSLRKAIGSGSALQRDSVSTVQFKAGTYLKMIEAISETNTIAYYNFALDFFTSPLTANGYSGLLATLDYYADGNSQYKAAATWLRPKVNALIAAKAALLPDDILSGIERSKKPAKYN